MRSITIIICLLITVLLAGFTGGDFFAIGEKEVRPDISSNFPRPVYDLEKNKATPEGFILGRKLFYDPILSKDYFISCGDCHQKIAAFAHIDHKLSHGVFGRIGKRNVPALQNLIWKDEFMADGSINHLDVQPLAPITNPLEMDETLDNIINRLRTDTIYPKMFALAFGDTAVTTERLMKSLTQFLSLMISDDSRYDRYVKGEEPFSKEEEKGLEVFRSRCASCHKEPLFTDNTYRNIGLDPDTSLQDSGRAAVTGMAADVNKFKVPSLRNIEMTYPYMHDGRFRNLEQVIDHYINKSFHVKAVDPQVLVMPIITAEEKQQVIAFLKTLTDKNFLYDRRFANPDYRY
jgi:cytochrome c peroxidase